MRNSPSRGAVAKRPAAHPCSMCSKRFTKRSNLRIHERLHTGERPYVCRFHGCGRSYKWLSSINFHEGRCERRAFGLASASANPVAAGNNSGVTPNTIVTNATSTNMTAANNSITAPNSNALPSSPVTPVRAFSNELVLPPATHLKRIAEAPTTTNPRRRHAPMPVSLPPPLPPTPAPSTMLAPTPSHPNHHPQHYQQPHQQQPPVLMQMGRALPPAPLPLPQFGAQYAHHPLAQPSYGMPTAHSAHLQRLLGGVAPPVPIAAPHVSSALVVDSHNHQSNGVTPKTEEEYVHVASTTTPSTQQQPTSSREMFQDSEQHHVAATAAAVNERARHDDPTNGNVPTNSVPNAQGQSVPTPAPATAAGGRVQCTVAGGVLDDLTSGGYGFDAEQPHSEVLLF